MFYSMRSLLLLYFFLPSCVSLYSSCYVPFSRPNITINSEKLPNTIDSNSVIDVEAVQQMLFDTSKPTTPPYDPFALPSPLSTYLSDTTAEMPSPPNPPQDAQVPTSFSFVPVTTHSNGLTVFKADYFPQAITPLPTSVHTSPHTGSVATTSTQNDKIDELMAQNARMEMMLSSLTRRVDFLQTQISTGAANPVSSHCFHTLPPSAFFSLLSFSTDHLLPSLPLPARRSHWQCITTSCALVFLLSSLPYSLSPLLRDLMYSSTHI
jgi:hypothetical protein